VNQSITIFTEEKYQLIKELIAFKQENPTSYFPRNMNCSSGKKQRWLSRYTMVTNNKLVEKETGNIILHVGRMFSDLYQCHVSQNDKTQHLTREQTEGNKCIHGTNQHLISGASSP